MTTHATGAATLTDTGIPGLRATTPFPLPFAPTVHARAFLLERPSGNLLVYSTGALAGELDALRAAGGAQRQYLNHWHESLWGFAPSSCTPGWSSTPPTRRRSSAAAASRRRSTARSTSTRSSRRSRFPATPRRDRVPGEERRPPPALHRRLALPQRRGWRAAVLESSDRARYLESLELIRALDFDVLVPWASSAGGLLLARVTPDERRARLDEIIARVRDGADA